MTDQRIIETASSVASVSTKTTMGVSGASLLAWVANLDLLALIGLAVGIGGFFISLSSFFVNWYYKAKENQRAEELHRAELKKLQEQLHVEQK